MHITSCDTARVLFSLVTLSTVFSKSQDSSTTLLAVTSTYGVRSLRTHERIDLYMIYHITKNKTKNTASKPGSNDTYLHDRVLIVDAHGTGLLNVTRQQYLLLAVATTYYHCCVCPPKTNERTSILFITHTHTKAVVFAHTSAVPHAPARSCELFSPHRRLLSRDCRRW